MVKSSLIKPKVRKMTKKNFAILLLLLVLVQPSQFNANRKVLATSNDNIYISMQATYNYWQDLKPTTTASYRLSSDTYWGNNSINLRGTERLSLSLTTINMEVPLTSSTKFKFSWKFDSTQYDYIGFILYTPVHGYWVVSYFGHTVFGNGSNQGIYEFANEQPNTWYAHTVNIGQLFSQTYGSIPSKITSVHIVNAYFGSTGLVTSNQVSYFDDFMFYSGNGSFISEPTPRANQNTSPVNILGNQNVWILAGLLGLGAVGLVVTYKSKANQKALRNHSQQIKFNPLRTDQNNRNLKSMVTMNICVNCHARIDSTDRFCANCGAPIISLK